MFEGVKYIALSTAEQFYIVIMASGGDTGDKVQVIVVHVIDKNAGNTTVEP